MLPRAKYCSFASEGGCQPLHGGKERRTQLTEHVTERKELLQYLSRKVRPTQDVQALFAI